MKILDEIRQDFDFLCLKGFSNPTIRNNSYIYTYCWVKNDIGIEIEIDLKEYCIYLLVVKVTNSKLPKGYYVDNGDTVRAHIQKFLKYSNIEYDKNILKKISNLYQRLKNNKLEIILKQLSKEYAILLKSTIDKLNKFELKIDKF